MPICFVTQTELDVRALTEMGLTAKPNTTTPIGTFGTGLKYTISCLVRMRIPFKLFIGLTEYEFYEKTESFRGVDYHPIYMRKRKHLGNWSSRKMPFNTNYGKNWELWMVYRELHANTLDEQGRIVNATDDQALNEVHPGQTVIMVYSKEFEEVWRTRDEIFLPWASYDKSLDETGRPPVLEWHPEPSKHVYYRGLRVYTSSKPFKHTYNILGHLALTEDRTASYWSIMYELVSYYTSRCQSPEAIQDILDGDDPYMERNLDWNFGANDKPSEAFTKVAKGKKTAYAHLSGFTGLYRSWYGATPDETIYISPDAWRVIVNTVNAQVRDTSLRDDILTPLAERFEQYYSKGTTLPPEIPEAPQPTEDSSSIFSPLPAPENLDVEVVLVPKYPIEDSTDVSTTSNPLTSTNISSTNPEDDIPF